MLNIDADLKKDKTIGRPWQAALYTHFARYEVVATEGRRWRSLTLMRVMFRWQGGRPRSFFPLAIGLVDLRVPREATHSNTVLKCRLASIAEPFPPGRGIRLLIPAVLHAWSETLQGQSCRLAR